MCVLLMPITGRRSIGPVAAAAAVSDLLPVAGCCGMVVTTQSHSGTDSLQLCCHTAVPACICLQDTPQAAAEDYQQQTQQRCHKAEGAWVLW